MSFTKEYKEAAVRDYFGLEDWQKDVSDCLTKLGFDDWMQSVVDTYMEKPDYDEVFLNFETGYHSYMPDTEYSVVTISVAMKSLNRDLLNETLRPLVMDGYISDYTLYGFEKVTTRKTGPVPVEGDLFRDEI